MENTLTRSPVEFPVERNEIAKALFKAQSLLAPLKKTETNPLYGSKYADLAGVLESVKNALRESGIVLIQGANVGFRTGTGNTMDQSTAQIVSVETVLLHAESGQSVNNILDMVPVPDVTSKVHDTRAVTPQSIGKTITYARRYALQALLGLAAEDDDANDVSQPQQPVREYKLDKYALAAAAQDVRASEPSYKESAQNTPIVEQLEGMSEISGKLSNSREKKYQDGATVYFFDLGTWTIWTKERDLCEELKQVQGAFLTVTGKRSKKKANMFEALEWRGHGDESEAQESE